MQTKLDPKTKQFLYQKLIYDFAPYLKKEPKDTSLVEVLLWLYSIAPNQLPKALSYNEITKKKKPPLKLQGILKKNANLNEKDIDEAIDWFNKNAEKVANEI
ncbi:MAG: hypothetical protein FJ044_03275 [Candidatus Cloacimonetes bacterium]|nr:hypothetical protein [Candidatus Cloacimonadota bacterium]